MRYPRPDPNRMLAWAQQLVTRLEQDYFGRPLSGEITLGAGATTEVVSGAVRNKASFPFVNAADATAATANPFVDRANIFDGRFLVSHTGGAGGVVRWTVL